MAEGLGKRVLQSRCGLLIIPVVDPILKGTDIGWANLGLAYLGMLFGVVMLLIARLVLFHRKR
jgi:hypothetical protein